MILNIQPKWYFEVQCHTLTQPDNEWVSAWSVQFVTLHCQLPKTLCLTPKMSSFKHWSKCKVQCCKNKISCEYAKKWECKSIWNVANCNQIETEVCTKKRKQILYKWEYNILFGGKYLYAGGYCRNKAMVK